MDKEATEERKFRKKLESRKDQKASLQIQLRAMENDLFAFENSKETFLNNDDIADRIKRQIERKKRAEALRFTQKMKKQRAELVARRQKRKNEVEEIIEEEEEKQEAKVKKEREKMMQSRRNIVSLAPLNLISNSLSAKIFPTAERKTQGKDGEGNQESLVES